MQINTIPRVFRRIDIQNFFHLRWACASFSGMHQHFFRQGCNSFFLACGARSRR